jgi:excisionase family DNA binding protein
MQTVTYKPTKHEQKIAFESLTDINKLQRLLKTNKAATIVITVGKNKTNMSVPTKALGFLNGIVSGMAKGKSITVTTTDELISTQQAADFLNVSRPHVVKLLEEGKIPFQKVGTHRRIKHSDLIAYDKKFTKFQERGLDLLTKQAQELNMGY